MEKLLLDFPARSQQIRTLHEALTVCTTTYRSVFVFGPPASGKTSIVSGLLHSSRAVTLRVNCLECSSSPSLLYESLQEAFMRFVSPSTRQERSRVSCSTLGQFCSFLENAWTQAPQSDPAASGSDRNSGAVVLVLDHVELLRTWEGGHVLGLLKLHELVSIPMLVIMVSGLSWEKCFGGLGCWPSLQVFFPAYTRPELAQIVNGMVPRHCDHQTYAQFTSLILTAVFPMTRSLRDIVPLVMTNYDLFCQPLEDGRATPGEIRKLWRLFEPHFHQALSTIHLPDDMDGGSSRDGSEQASLSRGSSLRQLQQVMELPYYSKFLLVAAYIASQNPAGTDQRFFAKESLRRPGKKLKAAFKRQPKAQPHLKGPKPFLLDRLMVIFYSIVDMAVEPSISLYLLVNQLVSLNLLALVSALDQIDSIKYRCLADEELVFAVARNVRFSLAQFLLEGR